MLATFSLIQPSFTTRSFSHGAPAGANFQFVPSDKDLLAMVSRSKSATFLPAVTTLYLNAQELEFHGY